MDKIFLVKYFLLPGYMGGVNSTEVSGCGGGGGW